MFGWKIQISPQTLLAVQSWMTTTFFLDAGMGPNELLELRRVGTIVSLFLAEQLIQSKCKCPNPDMCSPLPLIDNIAMADSASAVGARRRKRSSRRTVRFAAEHEVRSVLSRNNMTAEEKDSYWWTNKDHQGFRLNAKFLAVTIQKHGSSFVKLIDDSYKAAQIISDDTELQGFEIDELLDNPREYTKLLEQWAVNGHSRRGLERWISAKHREERANESHEARDIVLQLQTKGADAYEISEAYQEMTLTTKILARMLGYADHVANCEQEAPAKKSSTRKSSKRRLCLSLQESPIRRASVELSKISISVPSL